MRVRTVSIAAVTAAFAAVLASAPSASAEPDPPGCPRGYFCAWQGPARTGPMVVRTAGNWSGWAYYQSFFNNGYPSPGYDHVDIHYDWQGLQDRFCVHFNPGPGAYSGDVAPGAVITGVTWRGEC